MRAIAASIVFATLLALVSACASTHDAQSEAPSGPPSLVINDGQPAPPQARLYADCIAQAAANNTFDRQGNLIRFRCDGEVARLFYEGLGAYSAAIGSALTGEGRDWRFTQKPEENIDGLDYCWRLTMSDTPISPYSCTLVFNAGEFLNAR